MPLARKGPTDPLGDFERRDPDPAYGLGGSNTPAAVVLAFARAHRLSGRETEVLSKHLVEARTNKEIAGELGITYSTVRLYWMRICRKVGCRAPLEIIERLLRHALLACGCCHVPGDNNTTS